MCYCRVILLSYRRTIPGTTSLMTLAKIIIESEDGLTQVRCVQGVPVRFQPLPCRCKRARPCVCRKAGTWRLRLRRRGLATPRRRRTKHQTAAERWPGTSRAGASSRTGGNCGIPPGRWARSTLYNTLIQVLTDVSITALLVNDARMARFTEHLTFLYL